MAKKDEERPARPWRDNIEAITVSVIIIVLFKYFTLEAYKIPTGSMQPTLMGWEDPKGNGGVYDRVLVDKLSPHYRDFERFEIVVFKYPLDTSKSFIKRILGLPGERLEIRNGDVFVSETGGAELHALRRPRRIQDVQLKRLESEGEWKLDREWSAEGDTLTAHGPGQARFPRTPSVRDDFNDGYPESLRAAMNPRHKNGGRNAVGDLRVTFEVEAEADCDGVRVTFQEGRRNYVLELPGPAAPADARPVATVADERGEGGAVPLDSESSLRLEPGSSYEVLAQNLDDEVRLEVDGEVVLRFEVTPINAFDLSSRSGVAIATSGGGATFDGVEVSRDIYYTVSPQQTGSWEIPDDSYVMLGDNTQDSSDSRDWTLTGFRIESGPDAGKEIWGNRRTNENPRRGQPGDGGGPLVHFRDQLGELHVFRSREAKELAARREPFVQRSLIRGRAVVVVWPPGPPLSRISRFQWVR